MADPTQSSPVGRLSRNRSSVPEQRDSAGVGPLRTVPRRSGSGRVIAYLPQYDVRLRRELAHRRFIVSVVRHVLRLGTLHVLDAMAILGIVQAISWLTDVSLPAGTTPALIVFILLGLNLRGSYRPGDARRDPGRLISGVLIGAVLIKVLPAPVGQPAAFVTLFALASIAALIIERRTVDAIVHAAYARGIGLRRALVVGHRAEVDELLGRIAPQRGDRPAEDQVIVGYVSPDRHDAEALGSLGDLEAVLDAEHVSELLVATSLPNDLLSALVDTCFERGIRLLVVPSFVTSLQGTGWTELTRIGRWPAYYVHPLRLELPSLLLKRATDLVFAVLGLVVAIPLILVIGACIKLESRGPVFFRQRRVGLGGREFWMWKFRSMYHEAESRREDIAHLNEYGDHRLFKLRGDPRITRVGRLLRRFSLDELPQVFNILVGQMSFVGPRPPLPSEVQHYEPHHFVRLSVVPGLTGPWQVNGRNLIRDFEEVVRLERNYIETWSLRSDIEIILRTFGVVIEGKGAY
jgi:exopolysaccharide biosynthesis polyprenyl glycosylphosphotransferase